MAKFGAVIFDFNGVLFWDSALHEQSWRQFSEEMRGTALTEDEMVEHMHGRQNVYVLEYAAGRKLGSDEVKALTQQKEAIYRKLCLESGPEFRLSPGAIDLLDFLAEKDIPRTIATSSVKVNLAFYVEHLQLGRWFDVAKIVYDDGTYPGKPAGDIYHLAAAKIDLRPETCIVLEDSRPGIEAARRAGVGRITAVSTVDTPDVLEKLPGVDEVVSNLCEVDRNLLLD